MEFMSFFFFFFLLLQIRDQVVLRTEPSPFCVVDGVSEPRRVYDGEPQFDPFLLDADRVFDDVDCLMDPVCGHKRVQSQWPNPTHAWWLEREIFI